MLYYLFDYLDKLGMPGAGVFQYISFRAAMSIIASLIVSLLVGKKWIYFLQKKQIGETIRNLGLEGQMQKKGTPTMGGIIILAAILIPTLLFAKLDNVYVILMIITTVWLGLIGFLDDYIKVYKKNKEGLKGRFKVIGQIGLGIIVGATFYFSNDVVIREKVFDNEGNIVKTWVTNSSDCEILIDETIDRKSTKTTIPFFKNNEFDYESLVSWMGDSAKQWVWIIFILATIFIVTAVSNGDNLNDGLDGLAAGSSAII